MKKKLLSVVVVLLAVSSYAQRIGSSPIHYLDGKVGIGTAGPSEKLEVYNSNTKAGIISLKSFRNDAGFVDVGRISAKQDLTEVARIGMPRSRGTYTGYLTFWTKSHNASELTQKMVLDADGKVGIGTASPSEKLEVYNSNTKAGIISLKSFRNDAGFVDVGRICAKQDSTEVARIGMPRDFQTYSGYLTFFTKKSNASKLTEKMRITASGSVGIGTNDPKGYKLAVAGNTAVDGVLKAKEVKVQSDVWADFVFEKDYKLRSLNEVETFIQENRHLPDIPSEEEVKEEGISIGEMNARLLRKVEELTLYLIQQKKALEAEQERNEQLEGQQRQVMQLLQRQTEEIQQLKGLINPIN
jgi:hypothetical protein